MGEKGHFKSLRQALGLRDREVISLVGGGGKTSLMFALARELRTGGRRVITTTTTKILDPAPDDTPLISLGQPHDELLGELDRLGHVTVVSRRLPNGKLDGISSHQVGDLWKSNRADFIVVEADGSARRPLKAPESYEPVIPPCTTLVAGLIGAEAFGATLTETMVFRSTLFSELTGLLPGSRLTYEAISRILSQEDGILRGTPASARVVVFVNKVDLRDGIRKGREFARLVLDSGDPRIERIILGQVELSPPVVEIILR
jgi:probable selenium-dependent hydroxylase accessory protein YqeC